MIKREVIIRQAIIISQDISDMEIQKLVLQITLGNQVVQMLSEFQQQNRSWQFSFQHSMSYDQQHISINFLLLTGQIKDSKAIARGSFHLNGLSICKQLQKKIILLSMDQGKVLGLLFIIIQEISQDLSIQNTNPLFFYMQKVQVQFDDIFKRLRYVQICYNNTVKHIQRLKYDKKQSKTTNSVLIKQLKPSSFISVNFKQNKSGHRKAWANYIFQNLQRGKIHIVQGPLFNYKRHVIGRIKLTFFLNNLYLSNQWELTELQKRLKNRARINTIRKQTYAKIRVPSPAKLKGKIRLQDKEKQKQKEKQNKNIEVKHKSPKRISNFFRQFEHSQEQLIRASDKK